MDKTTVICCCIVVFAGINCIYGQTLEQPENTAVVEKKQGRVNCSADPGSDVLEWRHSLWGFEYTFWTSETRVSTDSRFHVEVNDAGTRFDLIILYANATCAGTFHVALKNANIKYDVEVVVISGLACHPDETGKETDEGVELVVTASTAYWGHFEPTMQWYSEGVLLPSHSWQINETKSVMYNTTATPDKHGSEYQGVLLFEGNQNGLTPPSYTDTCDTFYTVLYAVQDMRISPYPEEDEDLFAPPGSVFNCTAIGNPPPDFYWSCNNGYIQSQSPILVVPDDALQESTCVCLGQNYHNGRLWEDTANVTFITSSSSVLTSHTASALSLIAIALHMIQR